MRSLFLQMWANDSRVFSARVRYGCQGGLRGSWEGQIRSLPSTRATGAWGAAWGPWSDWSPWSPLPGTSHPPPCTPLIADAGSTYKAGNERIKPGQELKRKKKSGMVESRGALFSLICRRLKGLHFLENCPNTMASSSSLWLLNPTSRSLQSKNNQWLT